MVHEKCCFLTLTYDADHLPSDGSLKIRDYQLFLKRFRKAIHPRKVRYYISGEYGDHTQRPHYHCVLFGFDIEDDYLQLRLLGTNRGRFYSDDGKIVLRAWSLGNVHRGSVEPASVEYACKHITKGLKAGDPALGGREPEFSRMSLRPGIGANSLRPISDWLLGRSGSAHLGELGDVPGNIRSSGRTYSIGRYLRRCLRVECGMDAGTPERAIFERSMEVLQELENKGYDYNQVQRGRDALKADFTYRKQRSKGYL